MTQTKNIILTLEGLQRLEGELDNLKTVRRKEVAEKIKHALAFGDLSENSEYTEAKNEQGWVETRIVHLENMLKNAKVIDDEDVSTDSVGIGCRVVVLDMEFDEEIEYLIVGCTEADPSKNKISDESPVGKALIGKVVGDEVDVNAPAGVFKFKILNISK